MECVGQSRELCPALLPNTDCHTALVRLLTVTNAWGKQCKGGNACLSAWLQGSQSMLSWVHCFWDCDAVDLDGRRVELTQVQEAESNTGRGRDKMPFKGTPWWMTCFLHPGSGLTSPIISDHESINRLIHWWGQNSPMIQSPFNDWIYHLQFVRGHCAPATANLHCQFN